VNTNKITPIKIAVVVPKYGLVGGGEHFASEITERLACNENYEIHVFANRWLQKSPRIQFHKVPYIYFPRFLRPLFFAWYANWLIKRIGFDLIHTHHWIFKADIFSMHGIPHVGWIKSVRKGSLTLYDRAFSYVEKKAIQNNKSAKFLSVSSIALQAYKKEYGALTENWEIVHPGVDVERFSTPDKTACRLEIRKRYGINETDTLMLFVGMNFEVKGLNTIIAALAKAHNASPEGDFKLLVVGRGNENKYRRIAQSLGVEDRVIFAGTQTKGLERIYRAADVFIMLSTFDTFGMVVLEAMAAGLPVIVSSNVGAKDLVANDLNGYVLENPMDSDGAAQKITTLVDPKKRKIMIEAAINIAIQHDWKKLTEKISSLYKVGRC
jgi:UDP-glucose:(heptosyl)LPS alpha-1,3-glucosyltransferase